MPTGDVGNGITIQIWDNNSAGRNSFTYGAPADKRLYVHAETGETVYYAFGNQMDGNDLYYRIRRFDTLTSTVVDVVANTIMPTAGAGYIVDFNEAVAGPSVLVGATGYDALSFVAPAAGDYWIEFNRGSDQTIVNRAKRRIEHFDVTVFSSTATNRDPITGIVLGRLFSQSWDINCNSGSNPFLGTMFPYTLDRITLGIDFNGIRPHGFTINMNQFGTRNTGNSATDRLSRAGNESLPQYPIFLNNPDSIVYPTGKIPDLTISDVEARDCGDYVVRMEINAAGFVEALLDLDPFGAPDGVYTPGTRDVLLNGGFVPNPIPPAVTSIVYIPWDGFDGLGVAVPQGENVNFIAYVQSGLTHLPLFDVENHTGGFRVSLERPTYDIGGSVVADPNLFWDDQTILGDTRDLSGAVSPAHTWSGENNDTRNTWFYIRRVEQASSFIMDRLDFGIIDNGASGVCTVGQNNEFDQITFDVTINPNKYEAWELNYSTTIHSIPANYTLNLVSVDSTGATFFDADGLPRRTIFVTYEIVAAPETDEVDFDFQVTGSTIPDCPSDVSEQTTVFCDDILLPITLLDFNANHYSDNSILVDWQTASEKDNQGFYIQRSINGTDFKDLTFVLGKGTTNNQSSYEFIDEEYWTGTAYYRLAQLDNNGEINLTKVVSIEHNFTNLPFALYPNPNQAGGELNLRGISDKSSIKNLQVISITGQQVLVNPTLKTTFDGIAIDLPQTMAKGIYIIQFVTEFGMQNYKFVIE